MYQLAVISKSASLGQAPPPPPGPALSDLSIAERYRQIQQDCIERFGEEFCKAVLPATPIWLPPPERDITTPPFGLSWYVWAAIGFVLGKVL